MNRWWLALLFLAGGVSHEIRQPVGCHCISVRRQSRDSTPDAKT
jgi:hypothetical protein